MTRIVSVDGSFFTADTHLSHRALVADRSYSSVEEMDETLIARWNARVGPKDRVFHLGDVSFAKPAATAALLARLNGNIVLISGNHDRKMKPEVAKRFELVAPYLEINALVNGAKQHIVLMHFPMRAWNRSHYGAWHLHGHCHGSMAPLGRSMDVGIDTRADHAPWALSEIIDRLSGIPIHSDDHHAPRAALDEMARQAQLMGEYG